MTGKVCSKSQPVKQGAKVPNGAKKSKPQRPMPQVMCPSSSIVHGHFGAGPKRSPDMAYVSLSSMGGGTGSVTTKRELGLTVTDFFDYSNDFATAGVDQFVNNYIWDISQNLFSTAPLQAGGAEMTFCRVRKLEVWVLPQVARTVLRNVSVEEQPNNAQSMFTVNCQVPGTSQQFAGGSSLPNAFATNTQVTNVLPRIDTEWKKVLTANLQKTFQSGVIRPVFQVSAFKFTNQCLFSMSIVDSTTGSPYQDGDDVAPIRVKVKLTVDQPIGVINNAKLAVYRNEEFSTPFVGQNKPDFVDTVESYCQIDLSSVRDNLS